MTTYICTPYLNQSSRFNPYTPGDTLKVSALGPTEVKAAGATTAADKIFRMLNIGARPHGEVERSLSVGDVVVVEHFDPDLFRVAQVRLACEPHGWKVV
jgi:hypothetical protein